MFLFFDDGTSPCGIGGAENPGGPCTGSYLPSDAGKDVFSSLSSLPVVHALLAAAAIVAAVIFALWVVGKVARFFKHAALVEPVAVVGDEAFWAARGREANATQPDAEFSSGDRSQSLERDNEDDTEDDTESEDDAELVTHRLGYGR